MRSEHQKSVEWCMRAAGQKVRSKPEIPSLQERELRARLILEEALETIGALGFTPQLTWLNDSPGGQRSRIWQEVRIQDVQFDADKEPDLAEIADGCADIKVVTLGTMSSCGIADRPVMEEVLKKNKEKFPGGVPVILPGGKYGKPEGFVPPDIAGVLRKQGWEG